MDQTHQHQDHSESGVFWKKPFYKTRLAEPSVTDLIFTLVKDLFFTLWGLALYRAFTYASAYAGELTSAIA